MAARIVSWRSDEHSVPTIISIDSIQISSAVQEHPASEPRANQMSSEPSRSETLTSATTYPLARADAADDSFERHKKYYFKDGNVTFLVDGTLYCVHQYFFSRDSVYFSTRFDQLGIRDHEALPVTISLGNIKCKDFDAFLSILYPEDFEQLDLSYEEWRSVLHLSTHWDFASIRRLALNYIEPPTPHDRLLLARKYAVNDWVTPALSALCERSAPLSLDEARQMNIEDVVLVSTVREDIRNHDLQVDAAEIPCRVEAAQAGELVHTDSVDAPLAVLTNEAVEEAPPPVGEKQAPTNYETGEGDGEDMEEPGSPEDVSVRTEMAQPVEESGGDVGARRKAATEDVRSMAEIGANWKAVEDATRRKAFEEDARRKAAHEEAREKALQEAKEKAVKEWWEAAGEDARRRATEKAREKAVKERERKAAREEARRRT